MSKHMSIHVILSSPPCVCSCFLPEYVQMVSMVARGDLYIEFRSQKGKCCCIISIRDFPQAACHPQVQMAAVAYVQTSEVSLNNNHGTHLILRTCQAPL